MCKIFSAPASPWPSLQSTSRRNYVSRLIRAARPGAAMIEKIFCSDDPAASQLLASLAGSGLLRTPGSADFDRSIFFCLPPSAGTPLHHTPPAGGRCNSAIWCKHGNVFASIKSLNRKMLSIKAFVQRFRPKNVGGNLFARCDSGRRGLSPFSPAIGTVTVRTISICTGAI